MEPGLLSVGAWLVTAFGRTSDGARARLFTLRGPGGHILRVSDYGATLVEVHTVDRDGSWDDIVLGFDSVEGYQSERNAYFGATIGRVANRIANAEFTIGDRDYVVTENESPNHLHGGGLRNFSNVMWDVTRITDTTIELRYFSPDGEEGYPGSVEATAQYQMTNQGFAVRYQAATDAVTPLNMTNHSYWNLAGAGTGTVLGHEVTISALEYTPTDDALIPVGVFAPVTGTALDFRRPTPIGARINQLRNTGALGYDHNLVLDCPRGPEHIAARVFDPASGRTMEITTDQRGIQLYTGNRLWGQEGKEGRRYAQFGGLCLEPQLFPDALHHAAFPSILLHPPNIYRHLTAFRFTAG